MVMQRQRRLARAFRPVDLDDAALRQATDTERDVEAERARRNRLDLDDILVRPELHDRALAERPLDLRQRRVERLAFVHGSFLYEPKRVLCHMIHL
jgi:hypothetical protein